TSLDPLLTNSAKFRSYVVGWIDKLKTFEFRDADSRKVYQDGVEDIVNAVQGHLAALRPYLDTPHKETAGWERTKLIHIRNNLNKMRDRPSPDYAEYARSWAVLVDYPSRR